MQNKVFYYARVSSKEQHLDRQLEAFRKLGADERDIITDKESGKSLERSGYQALKKTPIGMKSIQNGKTAQSPPKKP